jgi:hypothetical protein
MLEVTKASEKTKVAFPSEDSAITKGDRMGFQRTCNSAIQKKRKTTIKLIQILWPHATWLGRIVK